MNRRQRRRTVFLAVSATLCGCGSAPAAEEPPDPSLDVVDVGAPSVTEEVLPPSVDVPDAPVNEGDTEGPPRPPDPFEWAQATCDTSYIEAYLPYPHRPSSLAPCLPISYRNSCRPWEHCSEDGKCRRRCDVPFKCLEGGKCTLSWIMQNGHTMGSVAVCVGEDGAGTGPSYPADLGASGPAEGGLHCWETLAELAVPHFTHTGVACGEGWCYVLGHFRPKAYYRLYAVDHREGAPEDDLKLVAFGEQSDGFWDRATASTGRLLAFERATSEDWWGIASAKDFEPLDVPVPHVILVGDMAAGAGIDLQPSGMTLDIFGDRAAPVPGSQHGCLLVPHGDDDLALTCFPFVDGDLTVTSHELDVTPGMRAHINPAETYPSKFGWPTTNYGIRDRVWRTAIAGGRIVMFTGHAIHHAAFDPVTDQRAGDWSTTPVSVPPVHDFNYGNIGIAGYGDWVLVKRMMVNIATGASSDIFAGTLPPGPGDPLLMEAASVVGNELIVSRWDAPTNSIKVIKTRFVW